MDFDRESSSDVKTINIFSIYDSATFRENLYVEIYV